MVADPGIAVALRGSPFTCMDGYLCPSICILALCFSPGGGGDGASSLTVARVARGDGTRLGTIRGGDQVMLPLPDLVAGLGGDGAGMCGVAKLSRNAGPQVAAAVNCA